MKILQCNKFYHSFGGTERYLFDLISNLSAHGHEIIPFAMSHSSNKKTEFAKYFPPEITFRPYTFKSLLTALHIVYSYPAQACMTKLLKATKPDVAHVHNIYHQLSTSIIQSLAKANVPIVMTVHDYKLICPNYVLYTNHALCTRCKDRNYLHAIAHTCIKNSYLMSSVASLESFFVNLFSIYTKYIRFFIAPSKFVYETLIDFGIPKKKVVHIPHAINLSDFTASNNAQCDSIVYFGKLYPHKGIETFIKAAREFPTVAFKIIGDGPYEQQLRKTAHEINAHNVSFEGYKAKDELITELQSAHTVVVPSEWYEVSGLTIYEAFQLNKCVIAANIGAIPELVQHNKTGLLFTPGNTASLISCIQSVLHDDSLRQTLVRRARTAIEQVNNQDTHRAAILNIYSRAIEDATA